MKQMGLRNNAFCLCGLILTKYIAKEKRTLYIFSGAGEDLIVAGVIRSSFLSVAKGKHYSKISEYTPD